MTPGPARRPTARRYRESRTVRLVDAAYPAPQVIRSASGPVEVRDLLLALEATDPDRLPVARAYEALPMEDRLHGEGTWDALTPFLYTSDGRFSRAGAGAYYAAAEEATAEAEWRFHAERRFVASGSDRTTIEARVLHSDLDLVVTDTRGTRAALPALYDATAGGSDATRAFAAALETPGLVYDSLRRAGADCVAVFLPRSVGVPVRDAGRLRFDWSRAGGWYRHPPGP